eukprot:tig00020614_g12205.t1
MEGSGETEELQGFQRGKFETYCELLRTGHFDGPFWDVVMLTAADKQQAASYEALLKEKLKLRDIPTSPHYLVVADPPGVKGGNGGATWNALDQLRKRYSSAMRSMRILLIHAGGYSQRLPNHSICGKIFAPLPILLPNGSLCTMLEMRFIVTMGITRTMAPGVAVLCADDIILMDAAQCDFSRGGFTAPAIRSPLDIAAAHGVFVLPPGAAAKQGEAAPVACEQFLHKPSVARMKERGAIAGSEGSAWTDSWFFFDHSVASRLLQVYDARGCKVECEVDAYGDFLQPTGPRADDAYIASTANVVAAAPALGEVRRALWTALRECPLTALPLAPAKFYHLGTCREYLQHLCRDECFLAELGAARVLLSRPAPAWEENHTLPPPPAHRAGPDLLPLLRADSEDGAWGAPPAVHAELRACARGVAPGACVMASYVARGARVAPGSVVEYSWLESNTAVGPDSIVSGVRLPGAAGSLPPRLFLQTVALRHEALTLAPPPEEGPAPAPSAPCFVTHAFGTRDDVKGTLGSQATLMGVPLADALRSLGLSEEEAWPEGTPRSLWNARVHAVCESEEAATLAALRAARALLPGGDPIETASLPRVSIADCLRYKDIERQIELRRRLGPVEFTEGGPEERLPAGLPGLPGGEGGAGGECAAALPEACGPCLRTSTGEGCSLS